MAYSEELFSMTEVSNGKNVQDIIPDREIIKMKNVEFAGLEYEEWRVEHPVFSDQIETLLENGYMVSTNHKGELIVMKQLNPSPVQLQQNKYFWNRLTEAIE